MAQRDWYPAEAKSRCYHCASPCRGPMRSRRWVSRNRKGCRLDSTAPRIGSAVSPRTVLCPEDIPKRGPYPDNTSNRITEPMPAELYPTWAVGNGVRLPEQQCWPWELVDTLKEGSKHPRTVQMLRLGAWGSDFALWQDRGTNFSQPSVNSDVQIVLIFTKYQFRLIFTTFSLSFFEFYLIFV